MARGRGGGEEGRDLGLFQRDALEGQLALILHEVEIRVHVILRHLVSVRSCMTRLFSMLQITRSEIMQANIELLGIHGRHN